MKNKLILSAALASAVAAGSVRASDINTNTARMQAMDKITGKVSEIDVPVNGLANFGTFSVLVRKCVTKSPEEMPENTAFVDIVDNYQTENPVNIFKGWMFSSTPALNAVEHPIYDIWLLKCYNADASKRKILSEEQLALRDSLPMVRPEAIKVSTSMTAADDNDEPQKTVTAQEENASENANNKETVTLDIESIAAAPEIKTEDDESFVSEGEEESEAEDNEASVSDNEDVSLPEPSAQETETAE